jgi:hypothetical protein
MKMSDLMGNIKQMGSRPNGKSNGAGTVEGSK